ncbi:MAG TPA: hypothetical protein VHR84_10355 [Terriglobales bacterium]|jgi:hypothetical protein|nr:hypothetical protein [Terriglobales bacterium]
MKGETRERWERLCELAADEQDHEKLLELVKEINDLLEAKEQRLAMQRKPPSDESSLVSDTDAHRASKNAAQISAAKP